MYLCNLKISKATILFLIVVSDCCLYTSLEQVDCKTVRFSRYSIYTSGTFQRYNQPRQHPLSTKVLDPLSAITVTKQQSRVQN